MGKSPFFQGKITIRSLHTAVMANSIRTSSLQVVNHLTSQNDALDPAPQWNSYFVVNVKKMHKQIG
jgi:hypothetical protein